MMIMTWRCLFYWKNSTDGLHFLLATVDPLLDFRQALSLSSAGQLLVCLATLAVIPKSHIWLLINSGHPSTHTLEKMSILFQQLKGKSRKAAYITNFLGVYFTCTALHCTLGDGKKLF